MHQILFFDVIHQCLIYLIATGEEAITYFNNEVGFSQQKFPLFLQFYILVSILRRNITKYFHIH